MIGSHSRKEEITQTNAPPPCFVRKKEETKAENSCQKSQTTWHRGKLLFSALDLVIGVLLQSRGSFASGPQGLLERLIFSSNRSTRRQFDDLRWNVPLEAGTLALQSLLLHHLHPWQHLATTQLDHSSCLMQLHRSAVAFTFLSLYLCFAFPSHCLRKLTCFIAVSLCPWWFVTNINRQTSSVYTLNTVELLPKESSRSPLWRGGESVVALLIHGMIYFLHKQNPGVNMCHRRSGSCFFPKLTNSEWSL